MNKTIILKLHENTDRSQVKKTIINCSAQAGHKTLYMKSDPNLSSMLFFVLFFFYEARQALRQNKAHEYNSSTNIVDHADGSSQQLPGWRVFWRQLFSPSGPSWQRTGTS
jgi:hypothetical protein